MTLVVAPRPFAEAPRPFTDITTLNQDSMEHPILGTDLTVLTFPQFPEFTSRQPAVAERVATVSISALTARARETFGNALTGEQEAKLELDISAEEIDVLRGAMPNIAAVVWNRRERQRPGSDDASGFAWVDKIAGDEQIVLNVKAHITPSLHRAIRAGILRGLIAHSHELHPIKNEDDRPTLMVVEGPSSIRNIMSGLGFEDQGTQRFQPQAIRGVQLRSELYTKSLTRGAA